MSTATLNGQQKFLFQQGYDYSPQELRELAWGLRFTPFVCMLGAVYGLATQQPTVYFLLAALGMLPFWGPQVGTPSMCSTTLCCAHYGVV